MNNTEVLNTLMDGEGMFVSALFIDLIVVQVLRLRCKLFVLGYFYPLRHAWTTFFSNLVHILCIIKG